MPKKASKTMASSVTNLPVVFKRVSRPLLLKIAFSTALQVVVGLAVLAGQHLLISHWMRIRFLMP